MFIKYSTNLAGVTKPYIWISSKHQYIFRVAAMLLLHV